MKQTLSNTTERRGLTSHDMSRSDLSCAGQTPTTPIKSHKGREK
jgi:hypothetical protein